MLIGKEILEQAHSFNAETSLFKSSTIEQHRAFNDKRLKAWQRVFNKAHVKGMKNLKRVNGRTGEVYFIPVTIDRFISTSTMTLNESKMNTRNNLPKTDKREVY